MAKDESAKASSGLLDPFFEVIQDGDWNACVGIQGTAVNYVDGYMEAARELVCAVIDKRKMGSRDTLAMPILYNCRHALELALKFAIDRLCEAGVLAEGHRPNHDIASHWRHLRDATLGDSELTALIGELGPFVTSLAAIDEDGQELRYARNRDGEKSLGKFAVVNLRLVRRSIAILGRVLDRLKIRVLDLAEDRLTGSHTRDCSRKDLKQIAEMLGDHSTWRDPDFDDRKAAVRERFGLSSGKFSDAIDAIRASRPLAAMVGLETPLKHLSDEKALVILRLWSEANPPRPDDQTDLGLDYFDRDWAAFQEEGRRANQLDRGVLEIVGAEELSDLEVIFYIGRNRTHGEHYDAELERTLAGHRLAKDLREGVHHLMSKMNLFECVIAGAKAAGRPSLAAKIEGLRPAPASEEATAT